MNNQRLLAMKINYYGAVNEYVDYFCEKQDLEFGGWVGDELGVVGWFNDYTLNFFDVVYDVDNEIEKGLIIKYIDYVVETENMKINYRNFCELRPDLILANDINVVSKRTYRHRAEGVSENE